MASFNYYAKSIYAISIILICCLSSSLCKQQLSNDVICENSLKNCDENGNIIVSRKKRALTFPEGSSLQLVYDQTIPIVAAQLLFTVGVTCALAFELPSKPLYHITQMLRESLLKREGLEEETTTTTAPDKNSTDDEHSRIDYNNKYLNYIDYNKQNYYDSMNKHNYYYTNSNNKYYQKPLSPNNYYASDKSDNYYNNYIPNDIDSNKYQSSVYVTPSTQPSSKPLNQTSNIWATVVNKFVNKYGEKVIRKKLKKPNEKYPRKKKLGNIFLRKHNRIYPVFGKRSVDEHLTDEENFYMEHHRSSRFSLYEKIQGFLNGKGKNGKACVLRALCETGQKNQNDEKGPFLLEILRAVFSLPHQTEAYKNSSHQHFDDAHSMLDEDCVKLYPQCEDSIWSKDFRF